MIHGFGIRVIKSLITSGSSFLGIWRSRMKYVLGKFIVEQASLLAVFRLKKEIGAFCHLVFAQIGNDKFLTAQLMGPFDAGGQDGVGLGRVAADDQNHAGI